MSQRFFISLKYKLTIVITLLFAVISIFIYLYFPNKFEKERLLSLQEKANSITDIAAYGLSTGYYYNKQYVNNKIINSYEFNEQILKSEVEKLIRNEEIRYVLIFLNDSTLYEYNQFNAALVNYKNLDQDVISYKWSVLKTHAPIMFNKEYIGDIYLGYSLNSVFSKIAELKRGIGVVSILLFISGALIIYLIGTLFTQPLSNMVKVIRKVSNGDLNQKVKITSNNELGYLSKSFNRMIEKIYQNQLEMDKINKELEQRVLKRTKDLEKALISLKKENIQRKKAEEQINNSLKEKEMLLKEIHHRVKNNLQIVSSLFFFQTKKIHDKHILELFREGQNRIKSMALIHEKLYKSGDLVNIDFKDYVQNLSNTLIQSYGINQQNIKFKNNVSNIKLSVDTAVPCGLIINELVSNSLKHAFKGKENCELQIDMQYDSGESIILQVSDNGKGIPENFNILESSTLGMKLVQNLTNQIYGTVEFYNDNGTTVKIKIPQQKMQKAS